MNPSDALIVLVGLVVVLVFVGWWRLTNAAISLTWTARTHPPESTAKRVEFTEAEVDEALKEFLRKRYAAGDEVKGAD